MRKKMKIAVFPLRLFNAIILAFSPFMVGVMLAITLYSFLFDNKVGLIIGVVIAKAGLVFGIMLAVDYMRKYKQVDGSNADDANEYDVYSNTDYWNEKNKGK